MLSYHPSGDVYHCIFRMLSALSDLRPASIEVDRLRIIDFYILFPHLIQTMRIPVDHISAKKTFKKVDMPFEELSAPKRMFYEIQSIQTSALRSLAAKGVINRELFINESRVKLIGELPESIETKILESEFREQDWYRPFLKLIIGIPLTGGSGLKARCNLMEFKYDSI